MTPNSDQPLKAYQVTIKTWPGMLAIYAAPSRAKAIQAAWESARAAEYDIAWQDHVGHRAPKFDKLAAQADSSGACLGWSYDVDGTTFGCLRSADDQVRHLVGFALLEHDLKLAIEDTKAGPLARLGNLAAVRWIDTAQVYQVFRPYPGDAKVCGDFGNSADCAEHLHQLATTKCPHCAVDLEREKTIGHCPRCRSSFVRGALEPKHLTAAQKRKAKRVKPDQV
jgi:hypothetical protein